MLKTLWKRKFPVLLCVLLLGAICIPWSVPSELVSTGVSEESVTLPVVMYHGMLKDPQYQGKYVISPDEFEQDLKYLQKNGYTPIHMADLFHWQDGEGELPEKPILLTFDDGYYNNYLYAWPLAKKYGMKIIIAPIGSCTDKFTGANDDHANYSHVTWPQIQEMMDSGLVEFQNHSYDLHGNRGGRLGAGKLRSESMDQYRQLLQEDVGKLQERIEEETGYTPTVFVFPFGAISNGAEEIIWEMGFRGVFTCESRMNTIHKDDEHLILGRYLRQHGCSAEAWFSERFQ